MAMNQININIHIDLKKVVFTVDVNDDDIRRNIRILDEQKMVRAHTNRDSRKDKQQDLRIQV